MKGLVFYIFLIVLSTSAQSQTIIHIPMGEKLLEILTLKKDIFVVTDKNMYQLKHKKLVEVYSSKTQILGAAVSGNYFYLLKKNSYEYFLTTYFGLITIMPLDSAISKSIIGLRVDSAKQNVYLITRDEGIYNISYKGTKLDITPNNLNDALFINDKDYWLATQSGLGHQMGNRYVRYVEESITGSSIPDNMVEHLHRTPDNRLIVQMAEALSIFELAGDKTEGHGTDLDFIGQKGNEIFDICGLPKGFTLFATQQGLILAGKNTLNLKPNDEWREVYSQQTRKAYRIKLAELGVKNIEKIKILRAAWDGKKSVYLLSANELIIVPVQKFIN